MLAVQLRPALDRELRVGYSPQSGLHSVLTLSSPYFSSHLIPAYCQRYLRLEEAFHRQNVLFAVIKMQCFARVWKAKRRVKALRAAKLRALQVKAAVVIQRYGRGKIARDQVELMRAVQMLYRVRDLAARSIQRFFKSYHLRYQEKVVQIRAIRDLAAIHMQKHARGYLVRKAIRPILSNPRISLLIRWRYPAHKVFIVGTFTRPHWKRTIPLQFSPYLQQFYSTFLMETALPSGKYYMKFIVDGEWKCDSHYYALEQDTNGEYNNVIVRTAESLRMKKSLSVHGLKQMEQSFSSSELELPPILMSRSNSGNLNEERVFNHKTHRISSTDALELVLASYMVAHPKAPKAPLTPDNSSDSCFINDDAQTFGLADGVGEWQHYGLNPKFYSNELMAHCDAILERELQMVDSGFSTSPVTEVCRNAMDHAYRMTENYGSSTAILAAFRENMLSFASLGDSAILVLRIRDPLSRSISVIYKSIEQQHAFNCPFQLTHIPKPEEYDSLRNQGLHQLTKVLRRGEKIYQDSCTDAFCEEIALQETDIVIAATDGLFDNLYDYDIATIAEKRLALNEPAPIFASKLAQILTETAVEKSWNSTYKSPFARRAQKQGLSFIGGKQDDTTVIVGVARVI